MDWLHFFHIAGAIVWVGGGLMLSVLGLRAKRSGDLTIMRDFAGNLSYVGLRVFTPAVLVVLVTGVWMVFAEGGGDFTQLWILLALGGFAIAFLIGAVYLSRTAIGLAQVANQADATPALAADALQRWITGYVVVLIVLVFTVWDMVFKPGL
jgi:uncharacterized membrane protein